MTIYKFKNPSSNEEATERYFLAEHRGDRGLFVYICNLPISPTYVYLLSDMVEEGGN